MLYIARAGVKRFEQGYFGDNQTVYLEVHRQYGNMYITAVKKCPLKDQRSSIK